MCWKTVSYDRECHTNKKHDDLFKTKNVGARSITTNYR